MSSLFFQLGQTDVDVGLKTGVAIQELAAEAFYLVADLFLYQAPDSALLEYESAVKFLFMDLGQVRLAQMVQAATDLLGKAVGSICHPA